MALIGTSLASLVFADHISAFPTAVTSIRSNAVTGVPPHIPSEEFISSICEAFALAAVKQVIFDNSVGAGAPAGTPTPVPVTFPGAASGAALLIAQELWVGTSSVPWADVIITGLLTHAGSLALLNMNPNPFFGTGTGVVSAAVNGGLLAAMEAALNVELPLAFQTNGNFGTEDVPGTPANPELLVQLPSYAKGLATGFATITATVAYAGATAPPATVTGVNQGVLV